MDEGIDLRTRIQTARYAQAPGREENDSAQDLALTEILLGGHGDVVENHAAGPRLLQKTACLARIYVFQGDALPVDRSIFSSRSRSTVRR